MFAPSLAPLILAALAPSGPDGAGDTQGLAASTTPDEPGILALAARQEEPEPTVVTGYERYRNFVELSVSSQSVMGGYRRVFEREDGHVGVFYFANDEDDVAAKVQLVRIGQVVGHPFRLGAGVGGYVALVDKPDANVYAIALTGLAEYDLDAFYPTTISAEASYAPDITTFDDGEELVQFQVSADLELSYAASAFVGYHLLEIDDGRTRKLDSRLHVGVRLGF
jgi:hypothetical protein